MLATSSSAPSVSRLWAPTQRVSVRSSAIRVSACSRHADTAGPPMTNVGGAARPSAPVVTVAPSSRSPRTGRSGARTFACGSLRFARHGGARRLGDLRDLRPGVVSVHLLFLVAAIRGKAPP